MCGIVGILNRDAAEPADAALVERMREAVAHRGPDGAGSHLDGPLGLGHRRLAILDVPGGIQPLASPDGRAVIVYNGEVYNYRELRIELEALGYWFRSSTDSEVVLNALAAWGVEALLRFNGMFALVHVEGLDAEAVARQDEPLRGGVPDREGEHAVQALDALRPPLAVGG